MFLIFLSLSVSNLINFSTFNTIFNGFYSIQAKKIFSKMQVIQNGKHTFSYVIDTVISKNGVKFMPNIHRNPFTFRFSCPKNGTKRENTEFEVLGYVSFVVRIQKISEFD